LLQTLSVTEAFRSFVGDLPAFHCMIVPVKIAVLDDYQNAALHAADWSRVQTRAEVVVFNDHLANEDALVVRLMPFDVVCVMRERTPLPRRVLDRLPNLKLICSTGERNASIDVSAAENRGIVVKHTRYVSGPTIELTWALILAAMREISENAKSVENGGWQISVGNDLEGKILGILGLGRIGSRVAQIARAFDMDVIAWSEHLTAERCVDYGARLVTKEQLLRDADVVTIHLVLSDRTRGLIGSRELSSMKRSAYLINTSRGPIVDERALISALGEHWVAGAALDTFDVEPLPPNHPLRTMTNVLATPHIGYVTQREYELFYRDTVVNIEDWLTDAR
jgi:phosphoglycerate dehydrogenase-like enzyme